MINYTKTLQGFTGILFCAMIMLMCAIIQFNNPTGEIKIIGILAFITQVLFTFYLIIIDKIFKITELITIILSGFVILLFIVYIEIPLII